MEQLYGLGAAARMIGVSASALKWQFLYGKVGDVERRGPLAPGFSPTPISPAFGRRWGKESVRDTTDVR